MGQQKRFIYNGMIVEVMYIVDFDIGIACSSALGLLF